MIGIPLVEVKHLRIERDSFTLSVPDWTVQPGQIVGVVGPNGAGKTTLLQQLAGIKAPMAKDSSGHVSVFGVSPFEHTAHVRSGLGYMRDDLPLFLMSINKLLRLVSGYYRSWDKNFALELMERFELDGKANTISLSKGEGTRLRLVLAMAFRPKVLVLDEPGTGLDLAGRRKLIREVLDIGGDSGRAVIISSHQIDDLERMVDHVLALSKGQVVANGAIEEIVGDDQTLEEAMIRWGAI